jgi:exopolysaccharide/PEP-CTERM locus tyrosine autokinase
LGKIFDAIEKFEAETRSGSRNATNGAIQKLTETREPEPSPLSAQHHTPSKALDKNLITVHDPSGYESEQFKILRTTILFPSSGERAKTIMITSALPGEGKSFVASNLAVSIAQNINEHVLLIDGDIRRPTQHKIFGFGEVPGLSEHLSEGTPLSSLILKTNVNKLSLLPSGATPSNPSELLSSESMSDLIQETKDRYSDRYVIIDSPPPRLTSETAALAKQVDGIILVIHSDSTPKDMVEKLVEMFDKEKILGIVMNRFDIQGSKYYGYGKYGYGAYGKKS